MTIEDCRKSIAARLYNLSADPAIIKAGIRKENGCCYPYILADLRLREDGTNESLPPCIIQVDRPIPQFAADDHTFVQRLKEALMMLAPHIPLRDCLYVRELARRLKAEA